MHPGSTESGANRRVHRRVPVGLRCWCETGSITLFSKLVNVSEGGVFICTFLPLGIGDRALLVLPLRGRELEIPAVVVWNRLSADDRQASLGAGLRFELEGGEASQEVRAYMKVIGAPAVRSSAIF